MFKINIRKTKLMIEIKEELNKWKLSKFYVYGEEDSVSKSQFFPN
jgi:hypothetical protein